MRRTLRVALVLTITAVLATAALVVYRQLDQRGVDPQPLAVEPGYHEIVWLSPATSASAWERFVAGVRRAEQHLREDNPGLEVRTERAFPPNSTDVPEVVLAWPEKEGRLVFRWYKLTSTWTPGKWVRALVQRPKPPLAIIGGSNSELARDLASKLHEAGAGLSDDQRPLLLLTTATADRVAPVDGAARESDALLQVPTRTFNEIYPERCFRYCFTNTQMARAVTRFIWSRDDLRPDSDPVYMVQWDDDSYSSDLTYAFYEVGLRSLLAERAARDVLWTAGCVRACGPAGLAGGVFPWDRCGAASTLALDLLPIWHTIPTSVGSFHLPNRYEAEVARDLSRELGSQSRQQRPLLIVTGQALPSRRFLRALERRDPERARRLVIATGDAVAFNTVYRDRRTAWPIQDLPMTLVFFCHYNPIDADAGFVAAPDPAAAEGSPGPVGEPRSSTGTEDVLLHADIVETLAWCFTRDGRLCENAAEMSGRLREVRVKDGRIGFDPAGALLFETRWDGPPHADERGNRRSGTGEHVVCLRPRFRDGRLLSRASLEVWKWQPLDAAHGGGSAWQPCGPPMLLSYEPPPVEGGLRR